MNNLHSLKVVAEGLIEGPVEKHETKLVKEKQSSFVTLQDFQSALHKWEQKMKGIICQVLADEIKYKNTIAELDDPSYIEPTKDPMQLANSIYAAAEVELGEAVEKHEETMKEAVEKHEETMLIKEKQSSYVTLQDLQSGLDELEWKMKVLINDVLWDNESDISEGIYDMFDPSSTETTNDLTQLPNSVYADLVINDTSMESIVDTPIYLCAFNGPSEGNDVKTKWYMMGDSLGEPSGVKFLVDSPPPCYVGESASVAVGHHILTVGGMDMSKYFGRWPPHVHFSSFMNSRFYVKDVRYPDEAWKQGPSMLKPRARPYATVVDHKLYVFGSDLRLHEEENQTNWYPWAEYLDLSPTPDNNQKWQPVGVGCRNAVQNDRVANGHAVLEDGKKILVYSSSTNDLVLYDTLRNSWSLHSTDVGPFCATAFMDGIMYGVGFLKKFHSRGHFAIFAYEFTKPNRQSRVVASLKETPGQVYPSSLIPVGHDKLYVLISCDEFTSELRLVCSRYRISKKTRRCAAGELDITAELLSTSTYSVPNVTTVVTFLAVPPSAMIRDCSDSKKPQARKGKKRRNRKKGNKIGEGIQDSSSRFLYSSNSCAKYLKLVIVAMFSGIFFVCLFIYFS